MYTSYHSCAFYAIKKLMKDMAHYTMGQKKYSNICYLFFDLAILGSKKLSNVEGKNLLRQLILLMPNPFNSYLSSKFDKVFLFN